MTNAIELNSVVKRYGAKAAVRSLTLSIPAGELFAFIGPNGAGKTTTIKMIAGLLTADEGEVVVCGRRMGADGAMTKREIAYVPDQPFLYDKLTGREFLHFAAEMYGVPEHARDERLTDLTERFQMEPFLDRLTEGYSHGMKQKVVLTAALLHEPRVLVIDEPMVGLDPKTVRHVKDLFAEHTGRGATIFLSTHTLEVAEAMADRIGIINHGELVAIGTLEELRAGDRGRSLERVFLQLTEEAREQSDAG